MNESSILFPYLSSFQEKKDCLFFMEGGLGLRRSDASQPKSTAVPNLTG
jgi:hypothetical protein